jgi:hypothetical protein
VGWVNFTMDLAQPDPRFYASPGTNVVNGMAVLFGVPIAGFVVGFLAAGVADRAARNYLNAPQSSETAEEPARSSI